MADSSIIKPPGFGTRLLKAARYVITGASEAWFSPGQPMLPMAPSDQAGRQFDYPIAVNLRIQPRPEDTPGMSFEDLRALAEYHDVTRLLIETRKDQLEALEWTIRPKKDPDEKEKVTPDQQARVDVCMEFFEKPDGVTPFGTWLRKVIEDLLVIDAPCIYVNTENPIETKFDLVDGANIKRFLDGFGQRGDQMGPVEFAGQRVVPRELQQLFVAGVAFIVDADDTLGALRPAVGTSEPAAGFLDPEHRLGGRGAHAVFDPVGGAFAALRGRRMKQRIGADRTHRLDQL